MRGTFAYFAAGGIFGRRLVLEHGPIFVTDETKQMVMENITYLLKNFLSCSQYENVLFCWVMQEESILEDLLSRLKGIDFQVYRFTLTATEQVLRARILKDVECRLRDIDVLERSLQRLRMYDAMHTVKIDVSAVTPREAAEQIFQRLQTSRTDYMTFYPINGMVICKQTGNRILKNINFGRG